MDDTEATAGEETWTLDVKAWGRPLTPSIINSVATHIPDRAVLAIAPTVSPAARVVARQHGWSVIATNPNRSEGPTGVLLRPHGRPISLGPPGAGEDAAGTADATSVGRRKGRPGYGRDQVVRLLLTGRPLTQAEIAEATGLSQPRISQVLRRLRDAELIRKLETLPLSRTARWAPVSWDGLLDHWLGDYRGPGGTRTYWYGLEDATTTAVEALEHLSAQQGPESGNRDRRDQPVLSGLVAADRFAHWARPSVGVIYSHVGADLQLTGLTPAAPEEATIHLVVPTDPGVWMAPKAWPDLAQHPIADPTQILWDLLYTTPVPDADQAAQKLRTFLAGVAANRTSASEGEGARRR